MGLVNVAWLVVMGGEPADGHKDGGNREGTGTGTGSTRHERSLKPDDWHRLGRPDSPAIIMSRTQ